MNPRKLTDEQEKALALEYLAGASISSLAERYQCSDGTIRNALRRCGASKRTRKEASSCRKVLTEEQERIVVEEYLKGSPLEVLGAKFTCSPVTVRNVLIRHDTPRRHCGRLAQPITPTKVCSSCNRDLPRSAFYNEGRRSSECRECVAHKSGDKYQTDPVYRQRKRDWARRHRSGWTSGQFEAMWRAQEGQCAICRTIMLRKGWHNNSVHADHDHISLRQRALLCSSCNRGLGCFKDSPDTLRLAAEYLEIFSEGSAMKTGT